MNLDKPLFGGQEVNTNAGMTSL